MRHAQLSFYAKFDMFGCHFRHVKAETTKRNDRSETAETSETKLQKRAKGNHRNETLLTEL